MMKVLENLVSEVKSFSKSNIKATMKANIKGDSRGGLMRKSKSCRHPRPYVISKPVAVTSTQSVDFPDFSTVSWLVKRFKNHGLHQDNSAIVKKTNLP